MQGACRARSAGHLWMAYAIQRPAGCGDCLISIGRNGPVISGKLARVTVQVAGRLRQSSRASRRRLVRDRVTRAGRDPRLSTEGKPRVSPSGRLLPVFREGVHAKPGSPVWLRDRYTYVLFTTRGTSRHVNDPRWSRRLY